MYVDEFVAFVGVLAEVVGEPVKLKGARWIQWANNVHRRRVYRYQRIDIKAYEGSVAPVYGHV